MSSAFTEVLHYTASNVSSVIKIRNGIMFNSMRDCHIYRSIYFKSEITEQEQKSRKIECMCKHCVPGALPLFRVLGTRLLSTSTKSS